MNSNDVKTNIKMNSKYQGKAAVKFGWPEAFLTRVIWLYLLNHTRKRQNRLLLGGSSAGEVPPQRRLCVAVACTLAK